MASVLDLRPCQVALVRVALGRDGAAAVVEKRIGPSLRRVNESYLAHPKSHSYLIRKADTGAYNCRKTTSGSSWSKHSYGAAVDVNWQTNPYGSVLVTDMPQWFRQLWLDEGWGWGGNWSGKKDAMHFSKFPNEGGDGKLEDPGQEDDMAQVPQAEWEQMKKDVLIIKTALVEKDDAVVAQVTGRKTGGVMSGIWKLIKPPTAPSA